MRNKKFIFAILAAAVLCVGCSKEEPEIQVPVGEPLEEVLEEAESVEEEEEEGFPVIEEREVVNGEIQSYLTGEWIDEEVGNRRPLAVMVPNNSPALPQYGLSKAGVIYEAPVEGRITRLMAVVEDYDDLERIGPVRSSRDYFIYVALEYDAIYCNWGLARPYVEELINSDRVDNVSAAVAGINKPGDEAFGRVKRPGYATEFTGYLFMEGYTKAVERLGYATDYEDSFVPKFTFAADNYRAEYEEMEDATLIYPGGKEKNQGGYGVANPYFEYNKEDGLYYRYQYGNKQIDEENDEQLAVSNVVFQYCHGEVRDAKDYLAFGVHGEGDCIVFTNGKQIKGRWMRYDGDDTPAKYYDEDGNEIIFNQGKTWVCNIWEEYAEHVEIE